MLNRESGNPIVTIDFLSPRIRSSKSCSDEDLDEGKELDSFRSPTKGGAQSVPSFI